jgi:hypothetical protein
MPTAKRTIRPPAIRPRLVWEGDLLVVYDSKGVYYGTIEVYPIEPTHWIADDGGVYGGSADDRDSARAMAEDFGRRMVEAYT